MLIMKPFLSSKLYSFNQAIVYIKAVAFMPVTLP